MKKLFLLTFISLSLGFAACDDADSADSLLSAYSVDELTQTLYADQISVEGTFNFTAADIWSTSITDVSGATVSWIRLSPSSGVAGAVEMTISVDVNTTGQSREALITIVCGGSSIAIAIIQSAQDEDGQTPNAQSSATPPNVVSLISRDDDYYYSEQHKVYIAVYNFAQYNSKGVPCSINRSTWNLSFNEGDSESEIEDLSTLEDPDYESVTSITMDTDKIAMGSYEYLLNWDYKIENFTNYTSSSSSSTSYTMTNTYSQNGEHLTACKLLKETVEATTQRIIYRETYNYSVEWEDDNISKIVIDLTSYGEDYDLVGTTTGNTFTIEYEYSDLLNNTTVDLLLVDNPMGFYFPHVNFTNIISACDLNGMRSKNLIKSVKRYCASDGDDPVVYLSYNYLFDDNGYLSEVVITDNYSSSSSTTTLYVGYGE